MIDRGKAIKFTPEENVVLTVPSGAPTQTAAKDCWLLGRVCTSQAFNVKAFKSVFTKLWQAREKVEIRDIGANLFTIHFFSRQDRDFVVKTGPWHFDGFVVVLKELDVDAVPTQVPLLSAVSGCKSWTFL